MDYRSLFLKCHEYIFQNITEKEINAQDLADECGYSLYHLSSVFRACMGVSVGRYITEEKMRIAASKLKSGKTVSEAAIEGGFDTFSGFAKAFRRHFGQSPREYKKFSGNLHGPEFVKRTGFKAFGYVIPVDDDSIFSEKGAFWSNIDFGKLPSYPENASDYAEIGTWLNPDVKTGKMDYFFGYVTNDPGPASGFTELRIGAGDYAVFRLEYEKPDTADGSLPFRVQALWKYIFEDWLSSSDKIIFNDALLCFELYGKTDIQIYVPVIR